MYLVLASEELVGHSTCMGVLGLGLAIMGSIVQPKRSCLRATTAGGGVGVFWYLWLCPLTYQKTPTTPPAVTSRGQDRLGTNDPMIALQRANTLVHVL